VALVTRGARWLIVICVYFEGHHIRESKRLDNVDVEDGVGSRMVVFRWPSVWLDSAEPYFTTIPHHLRLMYASVNTALTRPPTFLLPKLLTVDKIPASSHSLQDTMNIYSLLHSDNIV
jgi:hypothetical protein